MRTVGTSSIVALREQFYIRPRTDIFRFFRRETVFLNRHAARLFTTGPVQYQMNTVRLKLQWYFGCKGVPGRQTLSIDTQPTATGACPIVLNVLTLLAAINRTGAEDDKFRRLVQLADEVASYRRCWREQVHAHPKPL